MHNIFKNKLINKKTVFEGYQPLYTLADWTIHGNELILKPQSHKSSGLIIDKADKNKWLFEIDTYSINQSISTFDFKGNGCLFINVFSSTLCHPDFKYFIEGLLDKYRFPEKRVIFEIHETSTNHLFEDGGKVKKVLSFLRQKGFLIALVDVESQFLSLKKITTFEPEYIKLKKYLSKNLSESKKNQDRIRMFVNYCQGQSTLILADIEEATTLAIAKYLGVSIGQGFLLGGPRKLKTKNY